MSRVPKIEMEVPANSLSEGPEAARANGLLAGKGKPPPELRPAGTKALRHLFGPVALGAALSAIVILGALIQQGNPMVRPIEYRRSRFPRPLNPLMKWR